MLLTILKVVAAILLGVAGTFAARAWIARCYGREPSVLSYPYAVGDRARTRERTLTMALAFLFTFTALQPGGGALPLLGAWIVEFFCVVFIFTDIEQHVIFDRMLLPFAGLGILFTLVLGAFPAAILNHLVAALLGGLAFLLLAVATRGGIGGGDVKFIAALGLWFGTEKLITITLSGIVLGGLVALILVLTKQKGRTDYIAYGPYFAVAAIVSLLF